MSNAHQIIIDDLFIRLEFFYLIILIQLNLLIGLNFHFFFSHQF